MLQIVIDPTTLELLKGAVQLAVLMDVVATVLSLVCSYFPGFRVWFAGQDAAYKARFQVLGLLGLVILIGAVSFTKVLPLVPADWNGVIVLVVILYQGVKAGQAVYALTSGSQKADVIAAKAQRQTLNLPSKSSGGEG